MFKKMRLAMFVAMASLFSTATLAQDVTTGLEASAGEFTTTFVAAAAVIGGAMITAAFGGIVWKWIKGMIFS